MNSYVNLDLKYRIQDPRMTKLFDYKLLKALKLNFTRLVSVCSRGHWSSLHIIPFPVVVFLFFAITRFQMTVSSHDCTDY